jgi:hypothetical protein
VKTADLAAVLREFHREKLTLRQRHVAHARQIGDYEFNNAYQYIIAREDVHLQWLEAALAELGVTPDEMPEPDVPKLGRKEGFSTFLSGDSHDAEAFVARWRPRVAALTHARHRTLLDVVLGETLEHKRFFDQMVAGRDDLLGRRANGPGQQGTGDGVLGVRWIG